MKNVFNQLQENVSPAERGFSLLSGAYLLYDSLGKRKKNYLEAVLAGYLLYRGVTGNCAAYSAMGKTKPDNNSRNVNIRVSQIVFKPVNEVYDFWRDFENFPLFMEHLSSVRTLDNGTSVWEAKVPGDLGHVKWTSEIVEEQPYNLLGWRSLPGSTIMNAGKVEFEDLGDQGTRVDVVISYQAPGGLAGEGAARLINPVFEDLVQEDVQNFKWFIETNS